MSNYKPQGLDWYGLSKLNIDQPNLQIFHSIIKQSELKASYLDNIPLSHRKKLLLLFQRAEQQIQKLVNSLHEQNNSLMYKKRVIAGQQTQLQKQLEQSLASLTVKKQTIQDKKRTIQKMKEKIQKQRHKNTLSQQHTSTKQIYFCPFCSLNNFINREQFTKHVFSHQNINQSSENQNEWKQLILTLKDKEMEMLQMLLKQKKQLEKEQLQRFYEKEMTKFVNASKSFGYNIDQNNEGVELAGQSKYLFFKKNGQQGQKQIYQQLYVQKQPNQHKFTKQQDQKYFNCPSIQSQYAKLPKMNIPNPFNNSKDNQSAKMMNQQPYGKQIDNNNFIYAQPTHHERHQKIALNTSNPLYLQESKHSKFILQSNSKQSYDNSYHHPFQISKLDKYHEPRSSVLNETIYSQKKPTHKNKEVHIFNSGPLIDDKNAGDSDYEDYFGPKNPKEQSQEVGEQVIVYDYNKKNNNKGYFNDRKIDQKQTHKQQINNHSQSCIVDLSADSFSKRYDLSFSKESEQINLSDLKLSKLNKFIKQDKKSISQHSKPKIPQKDQSNFKPLDFTKKKSQGDIQLNYNILEQFTRQVTHENPRKQEVKRSYGPNQFIKKNTHNQTNVLNQFLKPNPTKIGINSVNKVIDLKQFMHP